VITAWKNYGCGSVIAKLDTQFDERIKDNILKTSSEIERTDVLKEKDDEYRYNDTISSSHDEFDSKSFAIYSSDEGINNVSEQLVEFVITALKIVGIIVISFFALVISLMYIHNLILGCVSSLVVGTLAYFLFRTRNSSNESKYERSPLYYVGLVIFAFFLLFLLFKFGEGMILSNINNPSQTPLDKQVRVEKVLSLEEQYISEIKIAKTKLPIVLDEYVSWTNIRRKSNGMLECDYLIDDANSDLYLIDLSAYKVELANKLKLISYKKYLELCMYSGYGLNCHLISKWDRSKSVDITFVNAEIGEILKGD